jgi:hypothetical protein
MVKVAALSAISGSAQAEKFGYMNYQIILEKYSAAKEVRAQLEDLDKGWEQIGLEMQSEIHGLTEQREALLMEPVEAKIIAAINVVGAHKKYPRAEGKPPWPSDKPPVTFYLLRFEISSWLRPAHPGANTG